MQGLYHLTAPNPVRNRDALAAFRRALGRQVGLPAPAWLTHPRLAATIARRSQTDRIPPHPMRFYTPARGVASKV